MSTATSSSRLARLPKLGRASRTFGRLWQAPTFLAGLAVLLAVAATAPLRKDPAVVQLEEDIHTLRLGLYPNGPTPDTLIAQADNLLARLPKFTRRAPEVHFLAGSAYFRLAEKASAAAAADARQKALAHFEEAFKLGVLPSDQAALFYRFGWVLYRHSASDSQLNRAIELMKQGVEKGADSPGAGYGVLVQAHLQRTPPDREGALAASQKQLELTDDRNVLEMAEARFTHAELLLSLGRRRQAIKELEQIGTGVPRELRLKARLLQATSCAEEGLWNKAIPLWQELAQADDLPGGKVRVLYHLGLCFQNADPPALEDAAKHWEEALALGGEEGRAAGLRLGELRLMGPTPDLTRGLEHWSAALASLRGPSDYAGALVPLDKARAWFEAAFKSFAEAQDFRHGERLATLYAKIAAPGRADELLAEVLHGQAAAERDKLRALPEHLAAKKREELRRQFHRAAVAYEQASTQLKDAVGVLWQSATCYLEAGDSAHAVKVLDRYVAAERDEKRLAEAWLSLAEARLALGEKEKARQAYYKCIEYPDTPFAYRARYELAVDWIERKNYDQAKAILLDNIRLTPSADRQAHEKSLYKLAALLLLTKEFDQAALRLKEAARTYPDNPLALVARDQLAECYRKLADQEKARMLATKNEEAAAHLRRKRLDLLEEVHGTYQKLVDDLETLARKRELDPADQAILRRALFGAADARFDANQFPEALRLYQGIQARYRRKIESLLSCQRIYKCVGVMIDSPAQIKLVHAAALEAVALAKEDLAALAPDADVFRGPGVWSHVEWNSRLEEIQERLRPINPVDARPGPAIR